LSVLTKVFVVLVTILSVMLVTVTVPFVANVENHRGQRDDALAAKAATEELALLRQSELSALQNNQSQLVTQLKAQSENLITQINLLTQKLANAEASSQSQSARNTQLEADWARLTAANQQHAQIITELQSELTERREQTVSQQTRMIQLADRNNELESQLDALTRQVRRVRENLTQLQEQNAELEGKLSRLPPEIQTLIKDDESVDTEPFIPETPIRGYVTAVEQLQNETFVQVDVGSNDGVEPNMKFMIHRDNRFLGTLIITAVDLQEAAGRVELMQAELAIGDAILTGGY